MKKYSWIKCSIGFLVIHYEDSIETNIALCEDAEKADFIAKACNQFDLEKYELELVNNNKEVVTN